jgi:MATE family multidrug resistance protein
VSVIEQEIEMPELHLDQVEGTTAPPAIEPRAMRRRVLGLAGPVIGENFLETLLGIVDTLLVAGLGAAAIAGVGTALQVMFFLISALSALSVGSAVLVAQAVGAGNTVRAGQVARQSLIWSGIVSIPLAIGGLLFSAPIVSMFGVQPDVAAVATDYMHVTMGTVVVLVALFIGSGALRGAGDSRTPLKVTAVANVVNVVLAYALIYGHLGLPALGPVGSAWATFIARGLALGLLVRALWRGSNGVSIRSTTQQDRGAAGWRPSIPIARSVLGIGVPAAVEQVLVSGAFLALSIVVAHLGTNVLAAHRVTFNALSLSFLPGIGFGIAATALVGQSIGARRIAEGAAAARVATKWALIWMSAIAVLLFIFAPQVLRLFTNDAGVIAAGSNGLRIMALTQPFWAVLFVQSGALRGSGNTSFPLKVTGTGIWVSVGLAALFVQVLGGGLAAVWAAFLVVAPFNALLLWRRFRRTVAET